MISTGWSGRVSLHNSVSLPSFFPPSPPPPPPPSPHSPHPNPTNPHRAEYLILLRRLRQRIQSFERHAFERRLPPWVDKLEEKLQRGSILGEVDGLGCMAGKLSRGEGTCVRVEVDAVYVEEEAVAGAEGDVGVGEPDWGWGR